MDLYKCSEKNNFGNSTIWDVQLTSTSSNMKLFLAILSITMMIQLSMAGSLSRSKRDNVVDFGESLQTFFYNYALASIEGSTYALEKMPKTDAYAPYRKELEGYLAALKEFKSKPDNCFKKVIKAIEKFESITDAYEKPDAPAEAQAVDKLLTESIDAGFAESFKSMFISFLKLVVLNEGDDVNEAKREEFVKSLQRVC